MNTRNNKRRRASVERIEGAFIKLIQEKELGEVTVSALCKECGLNRSTFYANYVDIYDLADKVREKLEAEVARLYETERTAGFNSNDFLKLFRHIYQNQLFYRTYFKLGYADQNQVFLYDTRQAERFFGSRHISYHVEFFKSGLNAILKLWLAGGCRETPEEMDEIVRSEYQGRLGAAGVDGGAASR